MARPFVWTPEKERALALEYAGWHTQAEIAAELGVTRRTVEGWVRRPALPARLKALGDAQRAASERAWQANLAAMRAEAAAHAATRAREAEAETAAWLAGRVAYWKAVREHRKRPRS